MWIDKNRIPGNHEINNSADLTIDDICIGLESGRVSATTCSRVDILRHCIEKLSGSNQRSSFVVGLGYDVKCGMTKRPDHCFNIPERSTIMNNHRRGRRVSSAELRHHGGIKRS